MITTVEVELVRCYRDLHRIYSQMLEDVAMAIHHSADVHLTSVDSQHILNVLEDAQAKVKVLNQRMEIIGAKLGER